MIHHQQFFKTFDPLTEHFNIAIALSGGADSMCLCYLTNEWSKLNNRSFIVLIVDHKLRPESTAEAQQVQDYLRKYGIKSEILPWDNHKSINNIHLHARVARYKLMTQYCKQNNYQILMTAHNQNDQAETVLMRILRGSGVDGISGIPVVRYHNDIKIVRPLLSYTRSDIEMTLKNVDWWWVNDPSNLDAKYDRTQIRNLISSMPKPALAIKRLALLAVNAQRTKKFIDHHLKQHIKKLCKESIYGYIEIDFRLFLSCGEEMIFRIMNRCLKSISGNHYSPRFKSLELLISQLSYCDAVEATQLIRTIHGCEVMLKNQTLYIVRELRAVENLKSISSQTVWDNRYIVETEEEGYTIGPLGKEGLKQLKKINKNLPIARLLYSTPAVFKNDILIHYPFNDHIIDHCVNFKKIKQL